MKKKNKEKHPKRRLKEKTVFVAYPDGSYVRISNYMKIIDKENAYSSFKRIIKST